MKTKSKKGFTLTELLVVVVVIAILAAVSVPIYKRTVERSHASDAIHVLDTISAKQEVVWVQTGNYATTFAQLAAPVKGLNTSGSATISGYTYNITNACATANKGDYTIYKNYITQDTGCTGAGCSVLTGLVQQGAVGCDLVTNPTSGDSGGTPSEGNICDIDPSACCGTGSNWNGSACITCTSPKVWNSNSKSCQCGNTCTGGGTPDPDTCACSCTGTCSGGKQMDASCNCACPAELPNWNGTNCVAACGAPKIRWTGTTCDCPLSAPIYVSSNNTCISACTSPKEWNGSSCVCPESSVTARINCIATGGTWSDTNCSCSCGSPRTQMSGTTCICPAPRTRFSGNSCDCPVDRPIYDSPSGTCIGDCATPTAWNFTDLKCECSAAALTKKAPCTSSGGIWSDTTCTCSCSSPRILNGATGECYCAAPRSYWTGSDCECPLTAPNWNANNSTCNPPCTSPKTYWSGTVCDCPTATPKYVSTGNECCLNTQGNTCGGTLANTLTGTMPCTSSTCECPSGSSLKSGYCCSDTYPNFINTSLGCCKTATAGNMCGGGITHSSATGSVDCKSGECSSCSGTYPTLRNGYCCLGSCTNGIFSGTGSDTCNCVCSTGFKFNANTGNCDSCGVENHFTWTDNQCNYSCDAGYCKDSSGACITVPVGQYRDTAGKCSSCTGLISNAYWTTSGQDGQPASCGWLCNDSYCYANGACSSIATGQWRSGNNCAACTNKPSGNSSYTNNGGTKNACPWTCTDGSCYDGSTCLTIPSGEWRSGVNCAACSKPTDSSFTGSGDTTGATSCPWSCNSSFCKIGWSCAATSPTNFRDASGSCVGCSGANCWNGSSCVGTTTTNFRNNASGLCVNCSGANCWNNTNNTCNATSNTLFRVSSGQCLACDASTTCYNSPTESCLSQSTTNFRDPSAGTCVTCSGSNCWTGSACIASSTTTFRNSSGLCVSCSGANCWDGNTCQATSSTNFRNSSGTCVTCSGSNCWNGSACVGTSTTNFRNSSGVCVACSGSNCWNGSSCVATTATNFRNATGICVACSGSNCWTSSSLTCGSIVTGQWRNTSGVCSDCTNKAANNSAYTGNGGTSNSCAWSCNSGYCYDSSDCITIPLGQWNNTNNCAACNNKIAHSHYTGNGGSYNNCPYTGDDGYCLVNTQYELTPTGSYRNGENCAACTNGPANTHYTNNGGTSNACPYTGNDGYCYDGSSYIGTPVGDYRGGEDCLSCTNKPTNTHYTGNGGTTNSCPYAGNDGYCFNGTSYITIPTGQWRSNEICTACSNKPANTHYTGNGGATNSCPFTGDDGYCYNGSSYVSIPVGQYRNGENCTACTNKPSYTHYTTNGGTTNSCAYSGDSGYCYNGTSYIATATGYYRSGENCAACSNKPANTYYTDDGGTSNNCPYSGNTGYCYDGSSYVPIATAYYRNGENCTACTNKLANTHYTGNGSTANACPYSGDTGYCLSGTSYVAVPNGYYRNGENCIACTNKPSNTYYTDDGGTSNNCPYSGNSGYCNNGTSYVSTPTGYYRSGETCTACTNKPANSSYTDDGGTSNNCPYSGNSGYCWNGGSYVSTPTGDYRNGEDCTACTNGPTNTHYTANGGTTNSCAYTGNTGYCYNGSSYIATANGYYRNGETCTACTNKPDNTVYTGNGGTTNSCAYSAADGYCYNGTSYIPIATAYYRNGETCTACSNKPSNSHYTGAGTTSNNCPYSGDSGYCWSGTSYISIATGQYRNGENCTACTNGPANTSYTGNGGTSNSCAYTGNTGYCFSGSSYIAIPTGDFRSGENCAACTNKPANTYYTGNGGTLNGCPWACNSGYCYDSTQCVGLATGQWRNGNNCATCTNKPANSYYTGNGGTSNACTYSGNSGYCWNGSAYVTIPTGQYRNGENCTACTNGPANTYYTSAGSTNNSCTYSGNSGYCYNGTSYVSTPVGYYRTGENCVACTNKATNTHYTGNGGTSNSCSFSGDDGYCFNGSAYVSIPTGYYRNGENCAACTNKPDDSTYTGPGSTSSTCAWSCDSAYYLTGSTCTAKNVNCDVGNVKTQVCLTNGTQNTTCLAGSPNYYPAWTSCSCNSAYCNNGTSCIATAVGYYRNGETCTACTNKPANTSYTGNGGTANSCSYSGNSGYCYNGTSYVTTATGYYRNGENCTACTNAPANTTYTDDGGTSNNCPYSGNSGYCYNGTSYVATPTGYYRSGENCTVCTNAPANTRYTGNGGTSNSCAYVANDGYCYNGTSYVSIPTGYYRSGETCTACTNKPANTTYTGNGGTSNSCAYSGNSGYCYDGSSYIAIPTGEYRNGENCAACSNKPSNTYYTSNGGTSNSCSYSGNSGYCYNGTSYVTIPVGQFRSGENCTSCTNKPTNTSYTGAGTTTSNCAYSGNSGYCLSGSSYISIPTGDYRSGENCVACTNKPDNSGYTGNGGTSNSCAWSCNGGYYQSGSTCIAKNVNCDSGNVKTQTCLTNGTQSSTCIAGSPNYWDSWGSCSCNDGYCNNGTSCIATATGYWRNGETCTACSNKPSNTYYTGNGGTLNNCAFSGNTGYCYNGSSYVTIATGYYRLGETCTACSNGPANTSYTGNGGTANSCPYSGNSGYCYNGTSYVATPPGSYRSGENCAACSNKPANTYYTDDGGTSNNCPYSGNSGYCYNGTSYVSTPTGQYRSGENCAACSNAPANTSYTGNGGTSNNCPYSGNSGYCYNGSSYVSIPTGQYRSGETCTACSNKPANTTYTGNGGTSNNCSYSGNSGYCYNGTSYVSIPTGYYRSGETCVACTNGPSNTYYTGNGGTANSCAYSGNSGYCYNGTSYVSTPTGQYRSGETCTACTNKPANTSYTGNGGTSNSCAYSGNSGYCYDGSSYVATATGYYRSGENCTACTNKPANTSYTGNGGTSNNCSYSGNSGYCYNGTSYVSIPTGQYRSGETCTACSNKAASNSTYTSNGGTSNACGWTCNSGTCYNGSDCYGTPTGQYRNGNNCASCTNGPSNTYYTSNGGTSNSCSYSGNSGYCYNGTGYVATATGYYRSGENCTACTNKPSNSTYTGNGGTSNACAWSCDAAYYQSGSTCVARNINCDQGATKVQACLTNGTQSATCYYGGPNYWGDWGSCSCNGGYCNNGTSCIATATGYYRSGETCTVCTNKPANTYYTGNGGTTNSCGYSGNSGYCYNGSSYIATPVGDFRSGENCASCTNKPAPTHYTGNGGTSNSCPYSGDDGYCYNGSSYVTTPTGYYRSGENCVACTNKPSNSYYTSNGGTSNSCSYSGNSGYCWNGSSYIATPVGDYRSGENCASCSNKPAPTHYTGNGGTSNNCPYSGDDGYCYNGSSYVTTPTGYYRSGETCTACTNKPANTSYTGNGGTSNSCGYSGNSGYCYNGSSYVSTPTGYYRSGENCVACTNGPSNTYYTGNGGTSNSCSYSGSSGYCYNGSSYVSTPTGYYRSGENCTACTNKPDNTYYTGNGGTSNSCTYVGNSGYCWNGSAYVATPTGYYRGGESCAPCSNKPANTYYTGNGGTSNSCPYTGTDGYCYNGSSYVSTPTGYYRSGETCAACSTAPSNAYYTSNGGTSNSCSWTCNSGYCYGNNTCVATPTGYYRSGNNCAVCTNAPSNASYTGNGGTSNACPYSGNSGYCWNGSTYVLTPTGYYRSGENCAACTNKASSNSSYSGNGGTSNSCGWSCNSGYCYNGSDCTGLTTGYYRNGNTCTACTNKPAYTYYTGNGGTSNSCPYTGNSGYCWNGSSYIVTPTGYYRNGENCATCSNAPSYSYYTGNGGTSNSCGWTCNSGYCYNGSTCTGTPTGYYRNGNNCAACTNAPSYTYYTGNGGTSNSCPYTGSSGYCWNGSSYMPTPSGYYRSGETCVSCSNAPSNAYYTSSGGTSNSCGWVCNNGYCYNGSTCVATPTGYYRSGTSCAACSNAPSYASYTGNGGTSNACPWSCNSGYCQSGSACYASVYGCSYSGQTAGDTSGCSGNGTRYNTCTSGSCPNLLYWGGWGSCSCNSGYSGSTCASCASGYCASGSSCYYTTGTCSSGGSQSDTSGCSGHGTRYRYCNTGTCPYSWGGWGSCSCDAGYCGSDCSSSTTATCSSGQSQGDSTGCSGHGTRYRYCNTGTCPYSWGSWGSCSCGTGYTGSDCSSCASGYCSSGGSCYNTTANCSGGNTRYVSDSACTAGLGRVQYCNTNTCPYSWTYVPNAGCLCDDSAKPLVTQTCCGSGTQSRTLSCGSNGDWLLGAWGSCSKGSCTPGARKFATCYKLGREGTQNVTCTSSCLWSYGTCLVLIPSCDCGTLPDGSCCPCTVDDSPIGINALQQPIQQCAIY